MTETDTGNTPSLQRGAVRADASRRPFSYTEIFEKAFPSYLAIGMTEGQFWDGDPGLVRHYRRAEEIRAERKNHEAWLAGLYTYEAICCASPILRAFAKDGTRPAPYTSRPHPLTEEAAKRDKTENERAVAEKGKSILLAMMQAQRERKKQAEQKDDVGKEVSADGRWVDDRGA